MSVVVHAFSEGQTAARSLAKALGLSCAPVLTHRFPDGEVLVTVPEPAETVIVYRSLDRPNDKLVELVLAAEAWRRRGARRLVLAAPYLAYMRQDRAFAPGQGISQRAVAKLLSGLFDRLVTVNAHLHRTHGLADIFGGMRAEDLSAGAMIGQWLTREADAGVLLVGPDEESSPLVKDVAARFGASWTTFVKQRQGDETVSLQVASPNLIRGRKVMLVDDICSTGATLMAAARELQAAGAAEVSAIVVHALFDQRTAARLRASGVIHVASTDSAPHPTNCIELAPLLARALADEVPE